LGLCRAQSVLQATIGDCQASDYFAFVVSGMFAVRHGGRGLAFKIAGQVVALKQDSVLGRPIPALDRRSSECAAMFISS